MHANSVLRVPAQSCGSFIHMLLLYFLFVNLQKNTRFSLRGAEGEPFNFVVFVGFCNLR